MFFIFFVPFLVLSVNGLTGYDCSFNKSPNITTISLRHVGDCNFDNLVPKSEKHYINLLQKGECGTTFTRQCKIKVTRKGYYCGMHSHISLTNDVNKVYILKVSREACDDMHRFGQFKYYETIIDNLEINKTNFRNINLKGTVFEGSKCEGELFESKPNLVVQADLEISLYSYEATIKMSEDIIILQSNTQCVLSTQHCIDHDNAYTYWEKPENTLCNFNSYAILFQGYSSKTQDTNLPTIYFTNSTDNMKFSFTDMGTETICGMTLRKTEQSKIYIFETTLNNPFPTKNYRVNIKDISLTAYFNTKLMYISHHLKIEINTLYKDIITQRCKLERQVIKNSLSQSSLNPDEFSFTIMKEPGYMAIFAGEVAHLIQCQKVPVKLRPINNTCYTELPVTYNNKSLFLTPKSRILTTTGNQRDCNRLLPTTFEIDGKWYMLSPHPTPADPPQILQPLNKPTWKYTDPGELAKSGIYSDEDLEQFKNAIMFPITKPAILNQIARGATGHDVTTDNLDMLNLLDERTLDKFAENAMTKVWSYFLKFGSFSAGCIAVAIIFGLIKYAVNVLFHGYTLYRIYGFGVKLIAAFVSGIANFLIHLGTDNTKRKENKANNDEENPPPSSSPPPLPCAPSITLPQNTLPIVPPRNPQGPVYPNPNV